MIAENKRLSTLVMLIIGIAIILFAGILLFINFLQNSEKQFASKIYPHVYIDSVNVGGKTKDEAKKIFNKKTDTLQDIVLQVSYHNEKIATFSAQTLSIKSDGDEIVERAYLIGRSSHTLSRITEKINTLLNLDTYVFTTRISYDKSPIEDFIENVATQYNKPAKNALFTFEEGRVTSFKQEENGLRIKIDKLVSDFDRVLQSLKQNPKSQEIVMRDEVVQPEITLSKSNNFGIEELIGEGVSNYSHSIPGRIHNLTLASTKFHGILIPKDKVFSFNEIIGDISASTGYQPAYVIKNGKTVLGDGGGVCQVSTTLFRAALNSGLPIVDRTAHAYRVSYYENDSQPGLDATIFSPSVDLKFKNDTPASILIQMEQDPDTMILKFKFYGKKDGRLAQLSPITVFDQQAAPPSVYQDDPTLKKGVEKQVDFAASGAKAKFHYKVTLGEEILFEKEFLSVYRPWAAVFLKGTAD